MIDFPKTIDEIASKFSNQYRNFPQAQSFLNYSELNYYQLQTQIAKHEQDILRREKELAEKTKELQQVEEHIPALNTAIGTLSDKDLVMQYRIELNQELDKKDRLEKWMSRNNANKLNSNVITYHMNRTTAAYLDAVATRLAEWVASGALGSGKVTYRDKTYEVQ